jgi:lipopolysaccharide assembly outer membrane protein LptD (OstA)
MKRIAKLLSITALSISVLALGQETPSVRHGSIRFESSSTTREGSVIHCRGNAVMETDAVILSADVIDFNNETQELQAQGNVRVKLKN